AGTTQRRRRHGESRGAGAIPGRDVHARRRRGPGRRRRVAGADPPSGASEMIRVFLVDDHEVVRRGVAELLDAQGDLRVVGESGTAASTLPRIAATSPDVVLLDVRLPDGDGIELCR